MSDTEPEKGPGDIVWAKVEGHPWWPGLVCKDPKGTTHLKTNKLGEQVHVQFFDQPPSHAWIRLKNVKEFNGRNVPECSPGGIYYSSKKTFWSSLTKAEKAEFMTKEERLKSILHQTGKKKEADTSGSPKKEMTKIKKRKMPEEVSETSDTCKKRRIDSPGPAKETFVIGQDKIPSHWETPFVLMSTSDVPEDLELGQTVSVKDTEALTTIKLEIPEEEDDINDIDSEDEPVDSDEDPGWTPDMEDSDAEMPENEPELEMVNVPENADSADDDVDEENLDDSDEDPGWVPEGQKKTGSSKKQKFGLIDRPAPVSSKSKKGSKPGPKSSLKSPASKTSASKKKGTSAKVDSEGADQQARNIVITDNTPTGPEPDVGDFVLEKAACKDGRIPYLWRYKRGGLIQKYERKVEDGKTFYQNVLSFSDWWSCFAHKYQKVKTQVMFKYKNIEKVQLVEHPRIEPEVPIPVAAQGQTATSDSSRSTLGSSQTEAIMSSASQRMQEQEISSTTQDTSLESSEGAFQIGNYVLDMKDKRNVDNFPIWKIESQILLKKYEPVIRNGRLLHKPVKTYRGYRDIEKHYMPVQVNRVLEIPGEEHVEVTEETKPKVSVSRSMEEEYEKNPLLRHFYVYMQVFLSQALEPGFLDEVRKTKDPTYMFPLGEIDKIVENKRTVVERKLKWTTKIKHALQKCPYLREVNKPDEGKMCEAVKDSEEKVEESVFLFGSEYDIDSLKQSGNSHPCQEFKIGKTAIQHISTYHQLCHFRYNLYDKCLAKIKLIRDSDEDVEVEKIMDECLGNKTWVLQNFEDFMTLVEIT